MYIFCICFLFVGCAERVIGDEEQYYVDAVEEDCDPMPLNCTSNDVNMCSAYAFEFDCYARQRSCPDLCPEAYRKVSDCFAACDGGYSAELWSTCMNMLTDELEECE